jgi:hypothetical protein
MATLNYSGLVMVVQSVGASGAVRQLRDSDLQTG